MSIPRSLLLPSSLPCSIEYNKKERSRNYKQNTGDDARWLSHDKPGNKHDDSENDACQHNKPVEWFVGHEVHLSELGLEDLLLKKSVFMHFLIIPSL
jgi:hypothetical protein